MAGLRQRFAHEGLGHRAVDPVGDPLAPVQHHHPVLEPAVEHLCHLAVEAGPVEVAADLGVGPTPGLGLEGERRRIGVLVEPAPPHVAGEVDDLGAGRLRHLDVTGPRDAHQLLENGAWIGHVLEQVGADRVVECPVGERHVGCVTVEEGPADLRRARAGTLSGVLGPDVAIQQDVGPPRRLVATADVEHEGVVGDRQGDAPVDEQPHLAQDRHTAPERTLPSRMDTIQPSRRGRRRGRRGCGGPART